MSSSVSVAAPCRAGAEAAIRAVISPMCCAATIDGTLTSLIVASFSLTTSYEDSPTTPATIAVAATTANATASLPRIVCGRMAMPGRFTPAGGMPSTGVAMSVILAPPFRLHLQLVTLDVVGRQIGDRRILHHLEMQLEDPGGVFVLVGPLEPQRNRDLSEADDILFGEPGHRDSGLGKLCPRLDIGSLDAGEVQRREVAHLVDECSLQMVRQAVPDLKIERDIHQIDRLMQTRRRGRPHDDVIADVGEAETIIDRGSDEVGGVDGARRQRRINVGARPGD